MRVTSQFLTTILLAGIIIIGHPIGLARPPQVSANLAGPVLSQEMNRLLLENKTAYLFQPVSNASFSRQMDESPLISWDYNSFLIIIKKQLQESRYQDAFLTASQLISLQPGMSEAYVLRGVAEFYMGDIQAAEKDANRALLQHPRLSQAYCLRATTRLYQQDYPAALSDSRTALRLNPNNTQAMALYGAANLMLDEPEQARPVIEKALVMNNQVPETYLILATMQFQMGQTQEAVETVNRAIQKKPKLAIAYTLRGFGQLNLGNTLAAAQDSKRSIALNPQSVYAHLLQAEVHMRQHHPEKGIQSYRTAQHLLLQEANNQAAMELEKRIETIRFHTAPADHP